MGGFEQPAEDTRVIEYVGVHEDQVVVDPLEPAAKRDDRALAIILVEHRLHWNFRSDPGELGLDHLREMSDDDGDPIRPVSLAVDEMTFEQRNALDVHQTLRTNL